jgi:hypothetical protein
MSLMMNSVSCGLIRPSSRRHKPLVADQGIDDEHADDEAEQGRNDAPPEALRALACLGVIVIAGCHSVEG